MGKTLALVALAALATGAYAKSGTGSGTGSGSKSPGPAPGPAPEPAPAPPPTVVDSPSPAPTAADGTVSKPTIEVTLTNKFGEALAALSPSEFQTALYDAATSLLLLHSSSVLTDVEGAQLQSSTDGFSTFTNIGARVDGPFSTAAASARARRGAKEYRLVIIFDANADTSAVVTSLSGKSWTPTLNGESFPHTIVVKAGTLQECPSGTTCSTAMRTSVSIAVLVAATAVAALF